MALLPQDVSYCESGFLMADDSSFNLVKFQPADCGVMFDKCVSLLLSGCDFDSLDGHGSVRGVGVW